MLFNLRFEFICRSPHNILMLSYLQPKIADEIVTVWRGLIPPGRFLARADDDDLSKDDDYTTGRWRDVGDARAKTKTCQCLRGNFLLLLFTVLPVSVARKCCPECLTRPVVSPEVTMDCLAHYYGNYFCRKRETAPAIPKGHCCCCYCYYYH